MPLDESSDAGATGNTVFVLPPDQIEDEARTGRDDFTFETLLSSSVELDFRLYEGSGGENPQPLDFSLSLPDDIPLIFLSFWDQGGNRLYSTSVKADEVVKAELVLPAAPKVYQLKIEAEGYVSRTISIDDMAAFSHIRRTVSMVQSSSGNSISLSAGARGIGPMRDSDGDGVPDKYDEFPDDPDSAFVMNIPADQNITIAFEDLFGQANAGDADYNDFIANYNIQEILDAEGRVKRLIIQAKALQKLAGYNHAFGLRIDSFEGKAALSGTFINSGGNEARLARRVGAPAEIVLFARTDKALGKEAYFVLDFDSPQYFLDDAAPEGTALLSRPPFNPYLYVYDTRHDIHLADAESLSRSINPEVRFIDDDGFPWALLIPIDWVHPDEGQRIEELYPDFTDWRLSGGLEARDWYENPYDPNDPGEEALKAYIAGNYTPDSYSVAAYWIAEDTTVNRIDLHPLSASKATDIHVDGDGNVYVSGFYRDSSGRDVAVYWKNGIAGSDLAVNARATGIIVDTEGTVYVSGYYWDGSMSTGAVYWSDDGAVSEFELQRGSYARGTDVQLDDAGRVYVSGVSTSQLAVYWIDTATGLSILSGGAGSNAQAIYHNGNNAFIAGRYNTGTAAYWREGVSTEIQLNSVGAQASGIWVDSGNVYAAGSYFDLDLPGKRAAWWLDDSSVQTDLFGEDSSFPTSATGIAVDGSDVYLAGTQTTEAATEAVVWKNGVATVLEPDVVSEAVSIFLAE
ncbi:LruC domain-containing protein [Marispirochaeta aestuarii]|nr:LruC domain-containing protein [Marispirochaeta aestuarii]